MGVIDSQIGVQVRRVAKRAREEAATPLQAELEVEAERREELEADLDASKVREAALRLEGVASAARIAALEAQLARTSSSAAASAAKAEATVEVAKGAATAARGETRAAKQSLTRARERVEVLEAKPRAPSSSGATTWTEEEVAEFEDHIGELTAELKVLKQEAKGNSTEYARNKGTVANMRGVHRASRGAGSPEGRACRERGPQGGARGGACQPPAGQGGTSV